jgi:hypothetical protein
MRIHRWLYCFCTASDDAGDPQIASFVGHRQLAGAASNAGDITSARASFATGPRDATHAHIGGHPRVVWGVYPTPSCRASLLTGGA